MVVGWPEPLRTDATLSRVQKILLLSVMLSRRGRILRVAVVPIKRNIFGAIQSRNISVALAVVSDLEYIRLSVSIITGLPVRDPLGPYTVDCIRQRRCD